MGLTRRRQVQGSCLRCYFAWDILRFSRRWFASAYNVVLYMSCYFAQMGCGTKSERLRTRVGRRSLEEVRWFAIVRCRVSSLMQITCRSRGKMGLALTAIKVS